MKHTILCFLIFFSGFIFCQNETTKGNIIKNYGKTYEVKNPDFKTNTLQELKVVFDIGRSFHDSTKVNPLIHSAVRYYNMHILAGVPEENLKIALVIHGDAAYDILNNKNYKAKFNIKNPNILLLSALVKKGVSIIVCGQTAAHKNITKLDVQKDVQFALSAMTALVQLQNENYRLINF